MELDGISYRSGYSIFKAKQGVYYVSSSLSKAYPMVIISLLVIALIVLNYEGTALLPIFYTLNAVNNNFTTD